MNTTTSPYPAKPTVPGIHPPAKLIWSAVIAGIVATLAIQIVLVMLGAGLGLAAFNPASDGDEASSFGAGAAVIQGVSAVLSLWAGGWIAGRFLEPAGGRTGRLHGFVVWCAATVIAAILLSGGAGWALGGLGKAVGSGIIMAGQPAIQGLAEMAKDAANDRKSMFSSFTEEGTSLSPGAKNMPDSIRAKRELSFAIGRLFTSDSINMPANQQAVVNLLVESQGTPEPEARRIVDSWVHSYQNLKADGDAAMKALEHKARGVAEKSANILAVLSICYFAAFLLGAVSATLGGAHGGDCAFRRHASCPSA